MSKVEEKLFQNRYLVDEHHPHIAIKHPDRTRGDEALLQCTFCCPAGCYTKTEEGDIELTTDGCVECGTCRIICQGKDNLIWEYPRGGFGVSFKFG
ncbi:MAG: ferredoxin family protein [Rhodospirillaceae bacterium]|nr:ferredoxin family protein [Rhodospirillaceae bacterium]MEA4839266.1 ferredoxin family protein [Rhodospirillaceae bacterium]